MPPAWSDSRVREPSSAALRFQWQNGWGPRQLAIRIGASRVQDFVLSPSPLFRSISILHEDSRQNAERKVSTLQSRDRADLRLRLIGFVPGEPDIVQVFENVLILLPLLLKSFPKTRMSEPPLKNCVVEILQDNLLCD